MIPLIRGRRSQSGGGGGARVLAVVLVLTLDQAQLAPQALAAGRQAAVVLQQLAVLLDQST